MKKGLKKLIAGAGAAMALAVPVVAGTGAGQEAKAIITVDQIVDHHVSVHGKDWQDKIWDQWYSTRPGGNLMRP